MWSEDDMMDIMPVKTPAPEAGGAEPWAARARRESEDGSPESAARALEGLASRIRSGEIQLPTFSAEMGEAAALAAARRLELCKLVDMRPSRSLRQTYPEQSLATGRYWPNRDLRSCPLSE